MRNYLLIINNNLLSLKCHDYFFTAGFYFNFIQIPISTCFTEDDRLIEITACALIGEVTWQIHANARFMQTTQYSIIRKRKPKVFHVCLLTKTFRG